MGVKRRRSIRFRKTKRLYVIATEGAETEPTYFRMFRPGREGDFRIKVLGNPGHKSAPGEVVGRLLAFDRKRQPGANTEYWAVIDRDSWEEAAIAEAADMIRGRRGYHLALSNPCFELWLYLHLRDNRPFSDSSDCQRALGDTWEGFLKSGYDPSPLIGGIEDAIRRAKALAADADPTEPWPINQGTHVYRLVEQLC